MKALHSVSVALLYVLLTIAAITSASVPVKFPSDQVAVSHADLDIHSAAGACPPSAQTAYWMADARSKLKRDTSHHDIRAEN